MKPEFGSLQITLATQNVKLKVESQLALVAAVSSASMTTANPQSGCFTMPSTHTEILCASVAQTLQEVEALPPPTQSSLLMCQWNQLLLLLPPLLLFLPPELPSVHLDNSTPHKLISKADRELQLVSPTLNVVETVPASVAPLIHASAIPRHSWIPQNASQPPKQARKSKRAFANKPP